MSKSDSPFSARFRQKVEAGMEGWKFSRLTRADFRMLQRAFVAALKEEVGIRFSMYEPHGLNTGIPLRIAGLGSFKMRTRPARKFNVPATPGNPIEKGASRRLVFKSKWEEIK